MQRLRRGQGEMRKEESLQRSSETLWLRSLRFEPRLRQRDRLLCQKLPLRTQIDERRKRYSKRLC